MIKSVREIRKGRRNAAGVNTATHHKLLIKEPGEILIAFRTELCHPAHAEISSYASQGESFGECLGQIGERLDIALDGMYDPEDLMKILLEALINKRNGVTDSFKLAKGLIPAELVERGGQISLEKPPGQEEEKPAPKLITSTEFNQ